MNKEQPQAKKGAGRCPICKDPTAAPFRPFCSARCRDIDLARWLSGSYAIPGSERSSSGGGATSRDADRDENSDGNEG